MNKGMSKFSEIITYILCGIAGSIILGFAVYRSSIFFYKDVYFYFVSLGIIGVGTLALVRFFKLWMAAIFVLVIAILSFIVLRILGLPYDSVLFYVFWYLLTGYAFLGIGCLFRTKIKRLPIGKFLIIAFILAVLFVIKTFVLYFPFKRLIPLTEIIFNAKIGFLIGCGLGIGVEVGELLGRFFAKSYQNRPESDQA